MERKTKSELREEAVRRLTEEVASLLRQQESENLQWRASRIDLMEALYTVFMMQELHDEHGHPYTFMGLVKQACRILHVKVPRNPYDCAARGRNRKGFIHDTYLDRYQFLLQTRGMKEPLWEEIG